MKKLALIMAASFAVGMMLAGCANVEQNLNLVEGFADVAWEIADLEIDAELEPEAQAKLEKAKLYYSMLLPLAEASIENLLLWYDNKMTEEQRARFDVALGKIGEPE